ncbi:MAG: 30S ribosomal protein S6 [Ardenticatenaceae bacterium]
MDELRRYELYVVFQPELNDEQLEGRIERTNGFLTGNRGEIIEVVRKGKRRLAYPIERYNQGIDVVYQAYLPASSLETLERQLNLTEDVIRYLLLRRDDLEQSERLVATEAELHAEVAELVAEDFEVALGTGEGEPEETLALEAGELPVVEEEVVGETEAEATPAMEAEVEASVVEEEAVGETEVEEAPAMVAEEPLATEPDETPVLEEEAPAPEPEEAPVMEAEEEAAETDVTETTDMTTPDETDEEQGG